MDQQFDRSDIMELLADERLERTADYVRRGRPLSSVETARLKTLWVTQFRRFIADPSDQDISARVEDIESELALRHADLPREEIRNEALGFLRKTIAHTQSLPREEIVRINEALARDCNRSRAARGPRQ